MTIDPEILKRLDAIGEKLGAAAGQVWPALMKQAFIEGVKDCGWSLFLGIAAIAFARYSWLAFQVPWEQDTTLNYVVAASDRYMVLGFTKWLSFAASFLLALGAGYQIDDAITCFANPTLKAIEIAKGMVA